MGKETTRRYNENIRGFVNCHSIHSPDDQEGDKFWKKVTNRMTEAEGIYGMMIYSFVRFRFYIPPPKKKKHYEKKNENLTDTKNILDCGKEFNRDDELIQRYDY